jgi:hypothetical protein
MTCRRSRSFMLSVRGPGIPALCRKSGHLYFGETGHLHFGAYRKCPGSGGYVNFRALMGAMLPGGLARAFGSRR